MIEKWMKRVILISAMIAVLGQHVLAENGSIEIDLEGIHLKLSEKDKIIEMKLGSEEAAKISPENRIDLSGVWKFSTDPSNAGLGRDWQSEKLEDSAWGTINVPGNWEKQGVNEGNPYWKDKVYDNYTGHAWYRRKVTIPSSWKGKAVFLNLGRINDMDWTYFNGKEVGAGGNLEVHPRTSRNAFRSYRLPEESIKYGSDNSIAVRVLDWAGIGGISEGPVSLTAGESESPNFVFSVNGDEKQVILTDVPMDKKKLLDEIRKGSGGDNVSIFGKVIVPAGKTCGDVVSVFGDVEVRGEVLSDAVSIFGSVIIYPGGRVEGNAIAASGGDVILKDGSFVGKNAIALSGNVEKSGEAMISGAVSSINASHDIFKGIGRPYSKVLTALIAGILAALIALVFPRKVCGIKDAIVKRPGASFLNGLLSFVVIPVLTLALVFTCVGIPFAAVLLLLAAIAYYAGIIALGVFVGLKLFEKLGMKESNNAVYAGIGTFILYLIFTVPVLGSLAYLFAVVIGMGAAVSTGLGTDPNWLKNRFARTDNTEKAEA